jgi:hypothetical protein
MQCLGKLDGPKCRIENIMDIFLFSIIFSIQAAITIPLLLNTLNSIGLLNFDNNWRSILLVAISLLDGINELFWEILVVSSSSHLCHTNYILHLLLICL